jgi:hypothetical protein
MGTAGLASAQRLALSKREGRPVLSWASTIGPQLPKWQDKVHRNGRWACSPHCLRLSLPECSRGLASSECMSDNIGRPRPTCHASLLQSYAFSVWSKPSVCGPAHDRLNITGDWDEISVSGAASGAPCFIGEVPSKIRLIVANASASADNPCKGRRSCCTYTLMHHMIR